MEYRPDCWIGFKINNPEFDKPIYKIFAGWYGGYGGSDSWKINSGITRFEEKDGLLYFYGETKSVYIVNPNNYRMSGYMHSVWNNMMQQIECSEKIFEIMPKETNWKAINF